MYLIVENASVPPYLSRISSVSWMTSPRIRPLRWE